MSRKQALNKPYWKKYVKQQPGYHRELGYNEDGTPAKDDNGEQVFRDRPNRAMKRAHYAMIRKDIR